MNKESTLEGRVGHLEIVVGSVNTKLDNVQNDVGRLTNAVDRLIDSNTNASKPNWGVASGIGALVLVIIAGYWSLAKQPYDLVDQEHSKEIVLLKRDNIQCHIEIARLEERIRWKK